MTFEIRKPFTGRKSVKFNTVGPSLTHQSMAPECDINTIMKKYEKTGILEHRNTFDGQYGNFLDVPSDYHEAMNAVLEANDMFESLPAKVRKRFHNDPGAFIEFATDAENLPEMVRMGLAEKREDGVLEKTAGTPAKTSETPPTGEKSASPSNVTKTGEKTETKKSE